jgi:hypothetical protein
MPGVGAGIGLDRVETMVGDADGEAVGVGVADGETSGVGLAVGVGEGLGDAVEVGITTGTRTPLDFFLTQTNLPDFARHSNSAPLFFAVSPAFLHVVPLFTAACEGAATINEKVSPRTVIHEREALAPLIERTITFRRALDMFPSCPTVYP